MNRPELSTFYKLAVIIIGGFSLLFAVFNLPKEIFNWGFVFFLAFTLLITPRMSIQLPRGKFTLSFSDSIVFLSFILYGGETAILIAFTETLVNCIYLKKRGVKFGKGIILLNVAATTLSTSVTYFIWLGFLKLSNIDYQSAATTSLIPSLGVLALTQFFTNSVLVAFLYSTINNKSPWQIWKRDCFSVSLTQIAGASLAGVVYKLIHYADFFTTAIALLAFGIGYVNYRQTVKEINETIEQAEEAEREKAEIAVLKAEQAEQHAAELKILLEKEEEANEELRQSKDALEHAAAYDFLTALPNRSYFIERLGLLIELGIDISHKYFVLFLDLKRFKNINDSLGHTVGDRVLRLVAKRLLRILRKDDTVARLGGDEFAIILNNLSSIEEGKIIAEQIYEKLTRPFLIQGNKIYTNLHIGIAPFDIEHTKPEEVLRDADIAMHYAKEKEIGVAVFTKEIRARFLDRVNLEADLRFALERREFSMHYQPLISLKDGELIGFEALLRWHNQTRGFVPPDRFIPIAEDSGLIVPITQWILSETCRQIVEWQKLSRSYENLIISVNISGKHLEDEGLIKDVKTALKISNLTPSSLKLEITESTAMTNAEHTIKVLKKLKETGVQLSMDDFGTGYSSLSYLHRLPFDTLKIDRSFVYSVGDNGENSEILQTIISLAKNLKMRVIAEGIETEAQLTLLQNLGCDYGQGYLMSKPLPKDVLEKLLYQKTNWLPFVETGEEQSADHTSKQENLHLF
ncbi:MAG: putative bifunctional diguanylate cyclase/phosphodiesterase [Pyrinomonadaceae bacterium]